jgi:hypothetical protein
VPSDAALTAAMLGTRLHQLIHKHLDLQSEQTVSGVLKSKGRRSK